MMPRVLILLVNAIMAVSRFGYAQEVNHWREDSMARSALTDLLRKAPISGSLEYSGHCGPQEPPILPQIRTRSDVPDTPLLVKLRDMFAGNSNMAVARQADGTIRMLESGVQRDILDLRIRRVSFNDEYDVLGAETLILSQPEVRAFMRENDINTHLDRFGYGIGLRQQPEPGLPHISETLENVTIREALDRLLRTFPGLWVYENCPDEKGGRVVAFDYLKNF